MGVDEGDYDTAPQEAIFPFGYDGEVLKIAQDWLKAKTEEEREPILTELLRHAILDGGELFFSFCRGNWEFSASTKHCPVSGWCEDCRE